ncbi:MAG TPA: hypothetical protein GXZ82_14715 [Firmicutes bacterium]|nr:hypothetical protein [Bacillota bacterium]
MMIELFMQKEMLFILVLLSCLTYWTTSAQAATDSVAIPIAPSELKGHVGAMVTLPAAGSAFVNKEFSYTDIPGQLVFSDHPEYLDAAGIASRSTVNGAFRIYTYHVNRTDRPIYILTWLVNRTEQPVTVRVIREGLSGPEVNYGYNGQTVLQEYFGTQQERVFTIPPGEFRIADPQLTYKPAKTQQLVHGIYDVVTDGPVDVLVGGAYQTETDPDTLPLLEVSKGGAGRGLFTVTERHAEFTVNDRLAVVRLASGRTEDPWVTGVDQIDNTSVELKGNYGVVYHIDVTVQVSEPRRVRFYMAPGFTSTTCPMAPAIRISDEEHVYYGGDEKGLVVRVPTNGALTLKNGTQAAFLGEIIVYPEQPRVLRLDFMPPGGSCLPAALLAWPVAMDVSAAQDGLIKGLQEALQPWNPPAEFTDDFKQKSALWSWALNEPAFSAGYAEWPDQVYAYGISGPPDGRNNALTVRARLDASGSFRLLTRLIHHWEGYSALISPPYVYLQRLEGNSDNLTVLATGSLQGKVRVGEWFTAQLVAEGNRFSVYIDDALVLEAIDPEDRYQQGRVGFRVNYTPTSISYAALEQLP